MAKRQRLALALAVVVLFVMMLMIVFSENGLLDLGRLRDEKRQTIRINTDIEHRNRALYREVRRLKSDPNYIESIARQELGLIGQGEVIIKAGNKGQDTEKR